MNIIIKIFFLLRNFFFPSFCCLCETSLIYAEEIKYGLCGKCRLSLVPFGGTNCNKCGKPLISEIDTCLPCRNSVHSYDRMWPLFPYTGKYRKLLTSYKFKKRLSLVYFFSEKISEVFDSNPCFNDAVIVPVPPRPGKVKDTGWDQVDFLVRNLKKANGRLPVSHCLKRRVSKAQKSLNRKDRLENLKDRIYVKGTVPQTALIIDDVITTGSTMEICANTLKAAGAKTVYGLCLFYD